MALTVNFSISTTADPSAIVITDTSTGTDAAVTGRKINLYDIQNNLYGASPYNFPIVSLSGDIITLNPLLKDKALNIIVFWTNNTGAALYQSAKIFSFNGYANQQLISLTRTQISMLPNTPDLNFYNGKSNLFTEVDTSQLAINNMSDIANAEAAIDRYTVWLQNPQKFF